MVVQEEQEEAIEILAKPPSKAAAAAVAALGRGQSRSNNLGIASQTKFIYKPHPMVFVAHASAGDVAAAVVVVVVVVARRQQGDQFLLPGRCKEIVEPNLSRRRNFGKSGRSVTVLFFTGPALLRRRRRLRSLTTTGEKFTHRRRRRRRRHSRRQQETPTAEKVQ